LLSKIHPLLSKIHPLTQKTAPSVSLPALYRLFFGVGLFSFGGGAVVFVALRALIG